jgi:hypothetical protein
MADQDAAPPALTAAQARQILDSIADLQQELADTRARLRIAEADLQAAQANQQLQQQQLQQVQAAPQQAAQPAPFAQTPATVSANYIDYQSTAGIKLYKMAGEKLKSEFDLEASKFPQFTDLLHSRAVEQGWQATILTINGLYLLRNYGSLSRADILAFIATYAFREGRLVQNSVNLFNCLESTLTPEALNILYADRHVFTVKYSEISAMQPTPNPNPMANGNPDDEFRDGVLFLWAIINRTTAQTNATVTSILDQLSSMTTIMEESKNDIKVFNTSVRSLLNQYTANKREEYNSTILINALFKAYRSTKDREFTEYMRRKQQDHDDNSIVITPNQLMESALKFYQTKVQRKTWEQDPEEFKEILNLAAQWKSFQKKLQEEKAKTSNNRGYNNRNNQRNSPNNDGNNNQNNDSTRWKFRKPKDLSRTKQRGGRTYHWCTKHNMWTMHKASECKLEKPIIRRNNNNNYRQQNNSEKSNNETKRNESKPSNTSTTSGTSSESNTSTESKKLTYVGPHTSMMLGSSTYEDY